MREQVSVPSLDIAPKVFERLHAPPPMRHPGELSRHFYIKNNRPVMMVMKLEKGAEDRFFYTENNLSAQWSRSRPPTFLPELYNHDEIKCHRSEPIFYVETEPEADMPTDLGLLATTYGRPAAIPPYQRDLLQGRTMLAIGRAGEDGKVHVNAVVAEFKDIATVRTFLVSSPARTTPPDYRLLDWLRDTTGEKQRVWLLGLARGERYPGNLPCTDSGSPLGSVLRSDVLEVPKVREETFKPEEPANSDF